MQNRTRNTLFSTTSTLACASLFAFAPLQGQTAVADFSGGIGTNPSTQFVGAAGEGWASAWNLNGENATVEGDVINTNPFSGSDNYLSVRSYNGTGTSNRLMLNRQITDSLAQQAHTIEFSLRFDDLTGWGSGDFIGIIATLNPQTATSSSSQTWGIIISGGSSLISFRSGPDGTDNVQSGLTLQEGVVYNFVLNIDPENNAWQGNITTSNGGEFSSGQMGYRSDTTTGRTININGLMNSSTDDWTYSLSGLSVTPIPEPSHAVLMMLGVCALAVPYLRRRKK